MTDLSKVILGTAQLTRKYGAERLSEEQMSHTSPSQILSKSYELGIRTLDTAPVYGDAELAISGHRDLHRIRIQTKWTCGNDPAVLQLIASMKRLKTQAIWSYVLHSSILDAGMGLSEELASLENALSDGRLRKIGFSVYSLEELDAILDLGLRDGVIQLPFNPLMQHLLNSRQVEQLVESGFEIQVRSVFMQGMLTSSARLGNAESLPSIEKSRKSIRALALELGVSANALLVEYAKKSRHSPLVVVGVSHQTELDLLIPTNAISDANVVAEIDRALSNVELTTFEANPMNWSTTLN